MTEELNSDRRKETADKSTQVFTHECLMQKMRNLSSSSTHSKRSAKTRSQKHDSNIIDKKSFFTTDYKSILYRNVLTRSHSEMMDFTEQRLFNFLDNMVTDYPMLACNQFDKYRPKESRCSKKDLNGKIKVYTKKSIRFDIVDDNLEKFIEMKETSTQTKQVPNYANPLNRKLFDKLYIDEDLYPALPV